jgi:hypothetical protein
VPTVEAYTKFQLMLKWHFATHSFSLPGFVAAFLKKLLKRGGESCVNDFDGKHRIEISRGTAACEFVTDDRAVGDAVALSV